MHSSRMHTGRSLTVCCSLLPGGVSAWSGGCLPGLGGVCLVWGGMVSAWSGGVVSAWLGGCLPGSGGVCLVEGGVCLVRGCLPGRGGVCLVWGAAWFRGVSPCRGGSPCPGGGGCPETPPVNIITLTCKNITLASKDCGR